MNERPTCKTCVFFDAGNFDWDGSCHRNPPIIRWLNDGDNFAVFPTVARDEFCGEHQDFPAWKDYMMRMRSNAETAS